MTLRSEDNSRLFPAITWDHGWSLSLQADKAGYQCSPKKHFHLLEAYDTVEAKIDGPHGCFVDPHTMQLPAKVAAKFSKLTVGGGPSIGANLTWGDVDDVEQAILQASLSPNDGVPRGEVGWASRTVYHGTSAESAQDIVSHGIDPSKGDGYFGHAFYVAEDIDLAISNYADFSGDEDGGAVIVTTIKEGAHILDLRNAEDSAIWMNSGLSAEVGGTEFIRMVRKHRIDGVYDRSFGGLAIFNAGILEEPRLQLEQRLVDWSGKSKFGP